MMPNWRIDTSSRQVYLRQRHLSPNIFAEEHAAVLREPHDYDLLRRKDDLLDEGIATVFGIKQGEAELQAIGFDPDQFTPEQAQAWLQERGLQPSRFRASGVEES
jgi:hypothetical protein